MTDHKFNRETGAYEPLVSSPSLMPSFVHQRQPSPHSCLPSSFAMVMGLDVEHVVDRIGHDDERGFHVQELLVIALDNGWSFVPFEFEPLVEPLGCDDCERGLRWVQTDIYGGAEQVECGACEGRGFKLLTLNIPKMETLLAQYDGVLTGNALPQHNPHAVAWCAKLKKCLDPRGAVYSLDGFEPDCFWLARKFS